MVTNFSFIHIRLEIDMHSSLTSKKTPTVKNVDGQNVEWDTRSMEKTLNSKKRRKDKTSNGK
jgi:hypothetical protein